MKVNSILKRLLKTLSQAKVFVPLVAVFLLAAPWFSSSVYYRHLLVIALVYVTLTTSLNLIMGYTGQLALGHAAFYGIGAYTFTILVMKLDVPYWIAFIAGGIMAAIWATFLGSIILRLKGHYLAIVTLAFGEIVRVTLYNWVDLTRGPMGLTDIPRPIIFSYTFKGMIPYYYLSLLIALAAYLTFHQLLNSRFGRAFIAVRDEENATKAMGIRTTYIKVLAFTIGCFFAGLAGSFLAGYIRFIHPDNFTAWESLMMNAMVVIGGEGSLIGSVLGAVALTVLPELLRVAEQFRMVIYAMVMIAAIILRPYGIVGKPSQKGIEEAKSPSEGRFEPERLVAAISNPKSHRNSAYKVLPEKAKSDGKILIVSGLTHAFDGLVAVNNVDLEVAERSIHSVIGPNGAGKTTFFNVLSGFYRPQKGSIKFKGINLVGSQPDKINRLGIARTFQKIRLYRTMTVLDNVKVACHSLMKANVIEGILHSPRMLAEERFTEERSMELLRYVGLAEKRFHFAENLSYGDQRKLEIARALATGVELLLLDEPTAGMSPDETQTIIELITELRDKAELTVVLIEHDMKVVMGISDIVTVLDHGTKIAEGNPKDIQNNELVIEAYLGSEPVVV